MSHPGVGLDRWEDLPNAKPIYLGAGAINTFYAWLRLAYGFRDENIRPYNFNSAPVHRQQDVDPAGLRHRRAVRDRASGRLQARTCSCCRTTATTTYATLIVTRNEIVEKKPDLVQRFVDASAIGWYHYLYGDNSRANALIKTRQSRHYRTSQIAFSIAALKEYGIVDFGDALKLGIGAMTDERWKDFFDKMVEIGMVDARTDYKSAYTLQFVNKGVGLDLRPK